MKGIFLTSAQIAPLLAKASTKQHWTNLAVLTSYAVYRCVSRLRNRGLPHNLIYEDERFKLIAIMDIIKTKLRANDYRPITVETLKDFYISLVQLCTEDCEDDFTTEANLACGDDGND